MKSALNINKEWRKISHERIFNQKTNFNDPYQDQTSISNIKLPTLRKTNVESKNLENLFYKQLILKCLSSQKPQYLQKQRNSLVTSELDSLSSYTNDRCRQNYESNKSEYEYLKKQVNQQSTKTNESNPNLRSYYQRVSLNQSINRDLSQNQSFLNRRSRDKRSFDEQQDKQKAKKLNDSYHDQSQRRLNISQSRNSFISLDQNSKTKILKSSKGYQYFYEKTNRFQQLNNSDLDSRLESLSKQQENMKKSQSDDIKMPHINIDMKDLGRIMYIKAHKKIPRIKRVLFLLFHYRPPLSI